MCLISLQVSTAVGALMHRRHSNPCALGLHVKRVEGLGFRQMLLLLLLPAVV
jgi:hypothetical protein